MIDAFRAELRKIWSVRSTYMLMLFLLALPVGLMGFWIFGYKDAEHANQSVEVLKTTIMATVGLGGILLSFIPLLSVTQEYRYNTVLYTLTSTNRRAKVFFAKWLASVFVAVLLGAIMVAAVVAAFYVGQNLHHVSTLAQTMPDASFMFRMLASIVGAASFGFIIAILLRSQVASIAVVLILPTTIETLLTLLLKDNTKYLPYTALGNLTNLPGAVAYSTSLLVVGGYVVALGAVALVGFVRRDAN